MVGAEEDHVHRRRVGRRLVVLDRLLLDEDVEPERVLVRVLHLAEHGDLTLHPVHHALEQRVLHLGAQLVADELEPAPRVGDQLLRRPLPVRQQRVGVPAEQRDQRVLGQLRLVEDRHVLRLATVGAAGTIPAAASAAALAAAASCFFRNASPAVARLFNIWSTFARSAPPTPLGVGSGSAAASACAGVGATAGAAAGAAGSASAPIVAMVVEGSLSATQESATFRGTWSTMPLSAARVSSDHSERPPSLSRRARRLHGRMLHNIALAALAFAAGRQYDTLTTTCRNSKPLTGSLSVASVATAKRARQLRGCTAVDTDGATASSRATARATSARAAVGAATG